jgi:transposase
MLKCGGRWIDCPRDYGPYTTIYNRFNRWSRKAFWPSLLEALAQASAVKTGASIDATYVKAQRAAFGGKGGRRKTQSVFREAARRRKSTPSPTSWADPSPYASPLET